MQNTDMVIELSIRPKKRWSTVVLVTLKQNITRQNVSDMENTLKRICNQNRTFSPISKQSNLLSATYQFMYLHNTCQFGCLNTIFHSHRYPTSRSNHLQLFLRERTSGLTKSIRLFWYQKSNNLKQNY